MAEWDERMKPEPNNDPPPIPPERRKQIVVDALGYDPLNPQKVYRTITPLPDDYAGSSLPAIPASQELIDLVRQQMTPPDYDT